MASTSSRSSRWCPVACCVWQPCRRGLGLGEPDYSYREYRAFMVRIWTDAKKHGHLLGEDCFDFGAFMAGVEIDIGLPPTLRHRLVTIGSERVEDLLCLRPSNVKWWANQDG